MGSVLNGMDDLVFGPRRGVDAQHVAAAARGDALGFYPDANQLNAEEARFVNALDQFRRRTSIVAALPAHNAPASTSLPIDLSARVTLPAAASDVWAPVVNLTLEPGLRAVVNAYGFDINDPAYTYDGSILFRLVLNGNAIPSLANIKEHRGTVAQPRSTFILLKNAGDLLSLQVRRASAGAGAVTVDGAMVGWTWHPTIATDDSQSSVAL